MKYPDKPLDLTARELMNEGAFNDELQTYFDDGYIANPVKVSSTQARLISMWASFTSRHDSYDTPYPVQYYVSAFGYHKIEPVPAHLAYERV